MPLSLTEMTISGSTVRLTYANATSKDESSEWVEMSLTIVGDDNRRLGVVQKAALLRLQTLIDEETQRLRLLSDQTHAELHE